MFTTTFNLHVSDYHNFWKKVNIKVQKVKCCSKHGRAEQSYDKSRVPLKQQDGEILLCCDISRSSFDVRICPLNLNASMKVATGVDKIVD